MNQNLLLNSEIDFQASDIEMDVEVTIRGTGEEATTIAAKRKQPNSNEMVFKSVNIEASSYTSDRKNRVSEKSFKYCRIPA